MKTGATKNGIDFTERFTIPPVGSHVSVTGSYVLDAEHGWMEIHPVSRIGPVR